MKRRLNEYVRVILPRDLVADAAAWLGHGAAGSAGIAGRLHSELSAALDRDRDRVSIGRIEAVLGKLGDAPLLEAIADALEAAASRAAPDETETE